MKKHLPIITIAGLLCLLLISCSNGEHIVIGKWQAENSDWQISFYPDETASLFGLKVKWTPIDKRNVKMEITENGQTIILEFNTMKDEKGLVGIYSFFGKHKYRKIPMEK